MGNECSTKCCGNEHEISTDQEVNADGNTLGGSNKQSRGDLYSGP